MGFGNTEALKEGFLKGAQYERYPLLTKDLSHFLKASLSSPRPLLNASVQGLRLSSSKFATKVDLRARGVSLDLPLLGFHVSLGEGKP